MTDAEFIPARRGPESKYNISMCEQIIDVATAGGHIAEMMVCIGVRSKETFYRWQKDYPEFKEAYEYSKIVSQAFHEKLGRQGAAGLVPNFNATAYAIIMNNKFSDDYKRGTGGNSTEITINTVNLEPKQLELKIAQKLEQLRSLGVDVDNEQI